MFIKLWSINKFLRWTGFRLMIEFGENDEAKIGLSWVGMYGSVGWKKWEPNEKNLY